MGLIQQLALWHNIRHRIVGVNLTKVNIFIANGEQKNLLFASQRSIMETKLKTFQPEYRNINSLIINFEIHAHDTFRDFIL